MLNECIVPSSPSCAKNCHYHICGIIGLTLGTIGSWLSFSTEPSDIDCNVTIVAAVALGMVGFSLSLFNNLCCGPILWTYHNDCRELHPGRHDFYRHATYCTLAAGALGVIANIIAIAGGLLMECKLHE